MSFLEDYEPVEERLRRFWNDHPNGRIHTTLVHHDERQYVIAAEVFTERDELHPTSTGFAEETVTSRGVNATNAIENCETSAIGRALANMNYAPKGGRPSREEMSKAGASQSPADQARAALRSYCKFYGVDMARVAAGHADSHHVELKSDDDAGRIYSMLRAVARPHMPDETAEGEQ